jgi:hypothetical protein
MNRVPPSIALCVAASVGIGAAVLASSSAAPAFAAGAGQAKKSPNMQDPPKDLKESPESKALQDLGLAQHLIEYGRAQKSAESLLLAAQILHKTPTQKLAVGSTVENPNKTAKVSAAADESPKALVSEAKKMSSSASTAALASATEKMLEESTRGAQGGPKKDAFSIRPGEVVKWNPCTFIGGQLAEVGIANKVHGAMVLEVFDEFGNSVARDNVPGPYFYVRFVPRMTGPFYIRLTNIDSISFNCVLITN